MTQTASQIDREYPRTVRLADGATATLRLMTSADAQAVLGFAQSLPPDDLLFLRIDITQPTVVDEWVENIGEGRTVTVLAEVNGEIAGYASLHHSQVTWQRHVGEIRIQVGSRYRSQGLGRRMAAEIFAIARGMGLRKITAQMTPDQKGAIATFERLGFQPEALLQDFVIDRSGRTRDLMIMAHDVAGFTDRAD
jgi:RimJ/RimL family protein N-acetyltransferase